MQEPSDSFDFVTARRSLVRFFQSQGLVEPEDAAQDAIAGLLRGLQETAVENAGAYLWKIARNIVAEYIRTKKTTALVELIPVNAPRSERQFECLDHCRKKVLQPAEWQLLLRWHSGEGRNETHRQLAKEFDIRPDALRKRVQRVMEKLGPCVKDCLGVRV